MSEEKHDKVVEAVRQDLLNRSNRGIEKYGTTLERNDLTQKDWLQHAYEEALDMANYLKRCIMNLEEEEQEVDIIKFDCNACDGSGVTELMGHPVEGLCTTCNGTGKIVRRKLKSS